MTNLYKEKLRRMSDEAIMEECLLHGKRMEKGFMNKEEKVRAVLCFTDASRRETLESEKEMLLTALRVLRIL